MPYILERTPLQIWRDIELNQHSIISKVSLYKTFSKKLHYILCLRLCSQMRQFQLCSNTTLFLYVFHFF